MAETRKARLEKVLATLERSFGRYRHPTGDLLDQLVGLILTEGEPVGRAEASFRSLKKEFLDWNEVRVSRIHEIAVTLDSLDESSRKEKASRVRSILGGVFAAHHEMSLEFLRTLDPMQRRDGLARVDGITPWIVHAMTHLFEDTAGGMDSPHIPRVAKRIGLADRSASGAQVRKGLVALVPSLDLLRLHTYLVRLGETVCGAKAVRCQECLAVEHCLEGTSNLEQAAKDARRTAAKEARASKKKKKSKATGGSKPARKTATKTKKGSAAGGSRSGSVRGKRVRR